MTLYLSGPTGPKGEQGPTGIQGLTGSRGQQGSKGEIGQAGNGGLNQILKRQTPRFHYGSKVPAVTITVFEYRNKRGKIVVKAVPYSVNWTRAIQRFALFDLLKSLYSDTKILSKYIPSLQKRL
jgi:hypothetical protein